jgi:hypothetical protein
MTKKNQNDDGKYTLSEIKEKYFPNRKLSSLTDGDDSSLSREAFLTMLEKISRPVGKSGLVKSKTSE